MRKYLNNKGYLLVEIILASVIAMVIAYFMTDLTIKLKNKNDDLLVRTLVSTDQAIVYNTIMRDLYSDFGSFSCSNITVDNEKFKYKDFTNVFSKYVSLGGTVMCSKSGNVVSIQIPLEVEQLPNENFGININFES